jgi:hypothetical protein
MRIISFIDHLMSLKKLFNTWEKSQAAERGNNLRRIDRQLI